MLPGLVPGIALDGQLKAWMRRLFEGLTKVIR